MNKLFTFHEISQLYTEGRVTPEALRRRARERKVPLHRFGRAVLIGESDVATLLNPHKVS